METVQRDLVGELEKSQSDKKLLPRYPIYIPSKGRYNSPLTINLLKKDRVPFHIVVEPQEYEEYASRFGAEFILTLPENNQGLIYARNWIKAHSIESGYARHWQLDDNINRLERCWRGKRIYCNAGIGLAIVEDFVERYKNVAVAGLSYSMFVLGHNPPFFRNDRVYSCTLVLNSIPNKWRVKYNDDTDLCLQVLSQGWCTILINAFCVGKMTTMKIKGGNTTDLYQGDGRLKMARALERLWPGVVTTTRKFQRPQHHINWKKFDTPLILRDDLDISDAPNEYNMKIVQKKDIRSPLLYQLFEEFNSKTSIKST